MAHSDFDRLIAEVRACTHCAGLPLGANPIVRGTPSARVLIISQAPGTLVHATGLSFNDRSGDRLREWLGIGRELFYDETQVAIMGMGFCYPGRDAKGGDLPPRPECAPLWHPRLRPHFSDAALTLLVGSYAIDYYLGAETRGRPMAAAVARWRAFLPEYFVLPHPSWRTIFWERTNPWFAADLLPDLRARIAATLTPPPRSAPCLRR